MTPTQLPHPLILQTPSHSHGFGLAAWLKNPEEWSAVCHSLGPLARGPPFIQLAFYRGACTPPPSAGVRPDSAGGGGGGGGDTRVRPRGARGHRGRAGAAGAAGGAGGAETWSGQRLRGARLGSSSSSSSSSRRGSPGPAPAALYLGPPAARGRVSGRPAPASRGSMSRGPRAPARLLAAPHRLRARGRARLPRETIPPAGDF
ncbi:collagen alpha-1(I) chain-like [Erinaceus europaeus]|uniref:Collagen alpha-1(I) chain-like n=1 Tax=Erinaceus europaeus TaxID=9365 RepID=A0ABM3WH12_ERIEU|nr:collagen alpha-1(I) chain-like [Erinaceus europaeus]